MDGKLLSQLYHRLFSDPSLRYTRNCKFSDALILFIWFFAVLGGVSPRHACIKKHWPICYRRLMFPSFSQLMRRLNEENISSHIDAINAEFKNQLPRTNQKIADGKPLLVGGYSKDPDAGEGHIPDGWGTGYKLHVLADSSGIIEQFSLTPLSGGESTALRKMLDKVDLTNATVRADNNYDSNRTYAAVADRGGRFIAQRKKPGTGIGHHKQHPHRLAAIQQLEGTEDGLKSHKLARNRVEQILGHLTGLSFGLAHLPNFVRRHHRVKRWVASKITLYHLHLAITQSLTAAA
jgi:hypothetical protein